MAEVLLKVYVREPQPARNWFFFVISANLQKPRLITDWF